MKKIVVFIFCFAYCVFGYSERKYNNAEELELQIRVLSSLVKEKRTKRTDDPYIQKDGNTYKYFSAKNRFTKISAPKQDYSDPFVGMLAHPESYFTVEITSSQIIIHSRELLQVSCGFSGPNNDPELPHDIQWTVLPQELSFPNEIETFYHETLNYNVKSTARHLVFQTPRNSLTAGGVEINDVDELEKNCASQGGAPQTSQTGLWGTNRITGKSRSFDDPYAPWRIVQDQKLIISFDELAKKNNLSKDELIWILFFTNLTKTPILGTTNVYFNEYDNAGFHFLLDNVFGLMKKLPQGESSIKGKLETLPDDELEPEEPEEEEDNAVYTVAQNEPSFKGGETALKEYLYSNLQYPEAALKNSIEGKVTLSCIVEKDGSISDIQVSRSPSPLLSDEAKRLVRNMPNWNPGKQQGKTVRVRTMLRIDFNIDEMKARSRAQRRKR